MKESEEINDLLHFCTGKRSKDVLVLSRPGEEQRLTYLDYAGSPPLCRPLLQRVFEEIAAHCLGNPHSTGGGPASSQSVDVLRRGRELTLEHFGLDPSDYDVVFTAGSTASIKLVGEVFPWSPQSVYAYCENAHTSLLGLRSFAPKFQPLPALPFYHPSDEEHSDDEEAKVKRILTMFQRELESMPSSSSSSSVPFSLFGLSGECNFSGAGLDFLLARDVLKQLERVTGHRWLWLVDGARLISRPSLPCQPDLIALSFYKLLGYPTGLGALIIKKTVMPLMKKQYFGGGTVLAGDARTNFLVPVPATSSTHFEDGTPNYQAIAALGPVFSFWKELGGSGRVGRFVERLRVRAVQAMKQMIHRDSGRPLCLLYHSQASASASADGSLSSAATIETRNWNTYQGPIIAFNLQDSAGGPIGHYNVQQRAQACRIQLRTGCFCNLGGCQDALGISSQRCKEHFELGKRCSAAVAEEQEDGLDIIHGQHTGACRVSFGYGSTVEDVDTFINFLREAFLDAPIPTPPSMRSIIHPLGVEQEEMLYEQHQVWPFPLMPRPLPCETTKDDQTTVHLAAIFVFPIKSCAGMRVSHWPVTNQGLLFDRMLAIQCDQTGSVLTQKNCPALSLLKPIISYQTAHKRWVMRIEASGSVEDLEVCLSYGDKVDQSAQVDAGGAVEDINVDEDVHVDVAVCGRQLRAKRISKDAGAWLTDFIHRQQPEMKSKYTYSLVRSNVRTGGNFANTAQYLLLSLPSVQALVSLAKETPDMAGHQVKVENFRPNLVISSPEGEPHMEDSFSAILLPALCHHEEKGDQKEDLAEEWISQSLTLSVTGPCARCLMVNINSSTGKLDGKVFQALRTYRKIDRNVYFGQFLQLNEELLDASLVDKISCRSLSTKEISALPMLVVGSPVQVVPKKSQESADCHTHG